MKRKFVILLILVSVKIFGCKCEEMNIQESFKYADYVFIGKVYEITQSPSGFKTINNFFSKVNIEKVYKLNAYSEFYNKTATLFSSQLRSCDLFYDNNTEYLVFGYIEPDTGLIYSEFCTQTKPLKNVLKSDLKTLEKLKIEYLEKDKNIVIKPAVEEIDMFINQPNILIDKLRRKTDFAQLRYEKIKTENKYLKTALVVIIGIIVILIIFSFYSKTKKGKKHCSQ